MIYPLGGGGNNSKQVENDLAEDFTDFMYTPDTPDEPPSTEISEAETELKEDSTGLKEEHGGVASRGWMDNGPLF